MLMTPRLDGLRDLALMALAKGLLRQWESQDIAGVLRLARGPNSPNPRCKRTPSMSRGPDTEHELSSESHSAASPGHHRDLPCNPPPPPHARHQAGTI